MINKSYFSMDELLNDKNHFLTKLNSILIIIFPITLLMGSLVSNLAVTLVSIFFLIDVSLKKKRGYI